MASSDVHNDNLKSIKTLEDDSVSNPDVSISPAQEPLKEEDEYPTDWRKIGAIMGALYLTMFLVALVSLPISLPYPWTIQAGIQHH